MEKSSGDDESGLAKAIMQERENGRRDKEKEAAAFFSAFRWARPGRAFFGSVLFDCAIEKFHVVLNGLAVSLYPPEELVYASHSVCS
jgi:hypothetical protein